MPSCQIGTNELVKLGFSLGFAEAAERIQALPLAKQQRAAIVAVPAEFVDQGALTGDTARIKKRFPDWEGRGITGLTISGNEIALRLMAELARLNVVSSI